MPLVLGSAFAPRVVEPEPVHEVTVESLQSEMLLATLNHLRVALEQMPAPVVHVDQPDLSAIVTAVQGIKGPADAAEIAEAIKAELVPGPQPEVDTVLKDLTKALERLDFRLKGLNTGGGGGGVASRIQNVDGTALATREALLDTRYEWQAVNGESRPLYIGTSEPQSPTATGSWSIQKYTYTGADLALVEARTGAWDSRASLF